MADITATPMVNQAVSTAKDLPDLVAKLALVDPSMAQQITGRALASSKSPPVILATLAVSYVASKFGFGWDETFCELMAFGLTAVAAYVMRYYTSHPISGLFTRTKTAPPAA